MEGENLLHIQRLQRVWDLGVGRGAGGGCWSLVHSSGLRRNGEGSVGGIKEARWGRRGGASCGTIVTVWDSSSITIPGRVFQLSDIALYFLFVVLVKMAWVTIQFTLWWSSAGAGGVIGSGG